MPPRNLLKKGWTGYTNQVLDRLPDFMDAVADGSQDDYLESNVPDGVQESLTFSVLKQHRK